MLFFRDELPLDLDLFSWIARDIRNFGFKIATDDHDKNSPSALQKISCEIKFVNETDKKAMSKMTKLFTVFTSRIYHLVILHSFQLFNKVVI